MIEISSLESSKELKVIRRFRNLFPLYYCLLWYYPKQQTSTCLLVTFESFIWQCHATKRVSEWVCLLILKFPSSILKIAFFLRRKKGEIKTFTARCGAFIHSCSPNILFPFSNHIEILYTALLFRNKIACGKSKYIKFNVYDGKKIIA